MQVVRYGRMNPETDTLDYPAFRPCPAGHQLFISYGPVPNLKLLSYYGFVIPNNPHDLVPLTLEPPQDDDLTPEKLSLLSSLGIGMEHALRNGPLAAQLLACLRVIVATPEEMAAVAGGEVDPMKGPLSEACEAQALETLRVALQGLLEPVVEGLEKFENGVVENDSVATVVEERNENGFDAGWKTSLGFCRVYMEGQRDILETSLRECEKLGDKILP